LIVLSEVEIAPGHRSAFFRDTRAVLDAMPAQTGLLGYSFRFEFLGRRAWTMTAWTDEAAMRRFVRSPAHLAAMQRAGTTTAATRFVRLRRPAAAVPLPWSEAIQLLAAAPASTDRTSPSSP
jgi:quinol monooxygenase YgiN